MSSSDKRTFTKRQRSIDRQEALIEIAETMCAELGPDAVTLRGIAQRAGIAAPSIYNHFSSLDDLLSAVIKKHLNCLLHFYDTVSALPPEEAISEICKGHVRIFSKTPGVAFLIQSDFVSPSGLKPVSANSDLIEVVNQREAKIIKNGAASGIFRDVDTASVTISRINISLSLMSIVWTEKNDIPESDQERIGIIVSEFVTRYLSAKLA